MLFGFLCQMSVAQSTSKFWYFVLEYKYDTIVYRSIYDSYYKLGNKVIKFDIEETQHPYLSDTIVGNDTLQIPHEFTMVETKQVQFDYLLSRKNNEVYVNYDDTNYKLKSVLFDTLFTKSKLDWLYYAGDTSIILHNTKFEVHRFKEYFSPKAADASTILREIYIDKVTLLPVLINTYSNSFWWNKSKSYTTSYSFYKALDQPITIKDENDLIVYTDTPLKWQPWQKLALYKDYENSNTSKAEIDCLWNYMNGAVTFYNYVIPNSHVKAIMNNCYYYHKK